MLLLGSALTLTAAFGAGSLAFRSLPLPRVARLGLGAVILSFLTFSLLQAGWAGKWTYLALASALATAALWVCPAPWNEPRADGPGSFARLFPLAIMGIYAALYAIYALAPESQPDAITYHLGLASEYARLGHFPARIGFYEVIPQGLEMLFSLALSFGGFRAAKLVHFAFFLGTLSLIRQIGNQLHLPDSLALAAAALYFCMPVCGITGTSAYNDAALVFFTLLTFYLLLLWHGDRRSGYLVAAGFAAGFCYALKITGLPIAIAATLAVAVIAKSPKPVALIAAASAFSIAPWMLRDLWLTGNPVAPLLNAWFPNPYFNTATERQLSEVMRSYGTFRWSTAPLEYALRGGLQGVTGPILFLLPLGFAALRKQAGRLLLLSAAVALLPWFWNVGTRFLMPSLPFLLLAFAMAVPRTMLYVCVAVQAVVCWPAIIIQLEDPNRWTLHEIPWRAAFHLEPESDYLTRTVGEYPVARMVERETAPRDRIFCLTTTARAYTTRELVDSWHSTPSERLRDALVAAFLREPATQLTAAWTPQPLTGVRITAPSAAPDEWRVYEIHLLSPGGRIFPSPQWSLDARPDRWETTAAFDENRATAWRTREPLRRGTYLEVHLDRAQLVSGAEILMKRMSGDLPLAFQGKSPTGQWTALSSSLTHDPIQLDGLRHEAITAVRGAGYRYVLAEATPSGMGQMGADMLEHPADWGVSDAGSAGAIHLFRIQ